ncbi:putative alpha/beta-fold hydrolase [Chryseobacterium sp. W4I1]|nr:putative alpha/beta-fold hydrolase [Chryseobacterium sp. W4I1]
MPDVGRFFNIDPLSEKYAYQSHYNFSENRVIDAKELEGLEAVKINDGTKNLIITVKGWQGGNPDPGKTQTKYYDKTSFVGALQKAFGSRSDTQVAVFDGSMNSRTPNDISTSIKDFRETSPDGKLILAGHSLGADNIVNVVNDNQNIKVDKTITIDISEPLGKADNQLSKNVNSADNYYQDNIFSVGGTKIEKVKGNNDTLINNTLVPNTTHTTIDNNKNVNDQIIKDVQKVISQKVSLFFTNIVACGNCCFLYYL